jgi:hypothetical protein
MLTQLSIVKTRLAIDLFDLQYDTTQFPLSPYLPRCNSRVRRNVKRRIPDFVKCPHCNHDFELTYDRYWRISFRKFACPNCFRKSIFVPGGPLYFGLLMGFLTTLGLLGVAIANYWLRPPQCAVGLVLMLAPAVPFAKFLVRRLGRLTGIGDPETQGTAICAECRSVVPIEDMIAHNSIYYCAKCKPIFLQKLAEGSAPPFRASPKHFLRAWWFWVYVALVAIACWIFRHYYLGL